MSRRSKHNKTQGFTYSKVHELMASPTEPLDVATRTHHLLRVYRGLSQLEEAEQPTFEDWLACSEAVSMTEALIEMGVASDTSGLLAAATEAMGNVAWSGVDRITARLEGVGRAAVREIVDCYADLLAEVPARTIIRAHRHSERRLRERFAAKDQRTSPMSKEPAAVAFA